MKVRPMLRLVTCAALLSAALASNVPLVSAQDPEVFRGRSLADALRILQARGLKIVFSSAIVTPDLHVTREPRGRTPREQLRELLAPHGLDARDGPAGTIEIVRTRDTAALPRSVNGGAIAGTVVNAVTALPIADVVVHVDGASDDRTGADGRFLVRGIEPGRRIVRASSQDYASSTRTVRVEPGTTVDVTLSLMPLAFSEHVTVVTTQPFRKDPGVPAETGLRRGELDRVTGLTDDPMRAVHIFPRVWAVDDYRSEFAVRGSPFRHVDLVVDGVSIPWLQHTAPGRDGAASVAMLAAPVLEDATLQAGAYPRRFGERLGPQLDLTLRQGSRERVAFSALVGATNVLLVTEGPLGSSARGSWLAAIRRSYAEWPAHGSRSQTAFGFSDGVAKIVYDVRPNHQVGLTVLAGVSNVDGEDDRPPTELGDGVNQAAVVNFSWRSTFGSAFVVSHRASFVKQRFENRYQTGEASDGRKSEEMQYRADIARRIPRGLLEAGVQVGRTLVNEASQSTSADGVLGASTWLRSAYAHVRWNPAASFSISPGIRVTDATQQAHPTVARWLLGEWKLRRNWGLNVSGGVAHQLPDVHQLAVSRPNQRLEPERASYLDLSIEHQATGAVRWQATVFRRSEDDILREPDGYPRLVGSTVVPPNLSYANALRGSFRGIELLVHRQAASGLSGWVAYSFGTGQYTDIERRERFRADFDQRHALSLAGVYRISDRTGIGATIQAGTNFPLPGYFMKRDGALYLGPARNQVRLPSYARLDLRADRRFDYSGSHLTVFAEVRNLLNRKNTGRAAGSVDLVTGEGIGFIETFGGRRLSGGVHIQF